MGTVNWIKTLLGISNETLHPLLQLLKGDRALNFKRLTHAVRQALQEVGTTASHRQAQQYDPALPFVLDSTIVLDPDFQRCVLLFQ